jgi:Flp pilus assembly protein TadG
MGAGVKTFGKRNSRGNRGSVLAWSALTLIPLLGFTGLSIDGARAYLVKSRLNQAVDAAALAGGKNVNSVNFNADIQKYFSVNFPQGYMGAVVMGPNIITSDNNEVVTVSAEASIHGTFSQFVGQDTITVSAKAVVRRSIRGMELALVMDNTGSMRENNKIGAMRTAAVAMVNSLYGSNETINNFWVSVVPYVATVNIGNHRTGWLANYLPGEFAPTTWKGCVEARTAPNDTTDATPSAAPFTPYNFRSTFTTPAGCTRAVTPPDTCTFADTTGVCARGNNTNCDNDWPRSTLSLGIVRSGGEARVTSTTPHGLSTGMIVEITGANQGQYNGWRTITVVNPTQFVFSVSGNPATPATGTVRANALAIDDRNASQNNGYGPNLGCATPITPLTPNRSEVVAAINAMEPWHRGGTFSNEGLVWGWRSISPLWRGLWGGNTPNNLPLEYESPNMDKVIVLLTDGVNEMYDNPPTGPQGSDYTAYGRLGEGRVGTTSRSQVTSTINARMLAMCSQLKQRKIIIYTILFQENDTNTQNLFRDCATSSAHFFNSPDNATLANAFKTIGQQLSNLRLQE